MKKEKHTVLVKVEEGEVFNSLSMGNTVDLICFGGKVTGKVLWSERLDNFANAGRSPPSTLRGNTDADACLGPTVPDARLDERGAHFNAASSWVSRPRK